MKDSRINCFQCIHYQVTWDTQKPKGCKLYNLKSQTMPSILVRNETGDFCYGFEAKVKKSKSQDIDLNRNDIW